MNPLRSLQSKGPAKKLIAGGTLPAADRLDLEHQLKALGAAGVRGLFEALPAGPPAGHVLEALDRLLTDETFPEYLEALRSTPSTAANASVTALSHGRGYDPMPLLPLFADNSLPRSQLETILIAQGSRLPLRALVAALTDAPREARRAIGRLLETRADASVAHELARLGVHTDPALRLLALKLLAHIDHPASVETAARLMEDGDVPVRLEAIRCAAARRAAVAIPSLCKQLKDSNLKVQSAAIEALIELNDARAVPGLIDCLKDESEYVRRAAVEVLNRVVTTEAIKDLVSALRDADWWVRVRAADALGTLGGERVVEALIGLLHDEDSFVRRYAVEILNVVPDARAVEPLLTVLSDPDWWVRERAIDALAKAGDPRATGPLLAMLSTDLEAMPAIVRALGAIGDPAAIAPLCACVHDEHPEVRSAALEALQGFAKRELPEESKLAVAAALREAGSRTGSPLELRRADPEAGRVTIGRPRHPAPRPGESAATTPASPPPPAPSARGPVDIEHLECGAMLAERYRIVRRLGGGGFGTVYLAEDALVSEQIALKLLAQHLARDQNTIQRFVEELKLTRRITHKNVIRIHEFLDLDGVRAISMEYVDGVDLGRLIQTERRLGPERALDLAMQALQGLAAAHELGIVHRDIKPANLLVTGDGTLKIVDFGLAAVTRGEGPRLTVAGTLVGTPEFMAPEQIEGGAIDARTDLYSLGCVLYYAISGREPYTQETAVKTLYQHLAGGAPPLVELRPETPPDLSHLVAWLMARLPGERPAGAAELLARLVKRRAA